MHDILWRGSEEGWLKPYIGGKFNLDDVVDSHKEMETRKGSTGKTILLID